MPRITPTAKQILITLVVAYVLQVVLENWLDVSVASVLAMYPGQLAPWQLLTYVLVGDTMNPLSFLVSMLFMVWALSRFEQLLGSKHTWQMCLVGLLSASVPAWLLGLFVSGAHALYGANVLWFTSVATVCWLDRNRPTSLFGVVSMTGQQFLLLLLGISVLWFLSSKNETQFVGDLGALAGSYAMASWLRRPRRPKKPPERKRARASGFKVIPGGQDDRNLLH